MNTVNINGTKITGKGNIVVSNGKIFVDGKDVTPDAKEINIAVNGNIETLEVDACSKVAVIGNVGSIKTASADVEIRGDVHGGIQTMSGDVDCGNIGGSVSTMSGDIKQKR